MAGKKYAKLVALNIHPMKYFGWADAGKGSLTVGEDVHRDVVRRITSPNGGKGDFLIRCGGINAESKPLIEAFIAAKMIAYDLTESPVVSFIIEKRPVDITKARKEEVVPSIYPCPVG